MFPSSIKYGVKTLGCDEMICFSDSNSSGSLMASVLVGFESETYCVCGSRSVFRLIVTLVVGKRFFKIECLGVVSLVLMFVGCFVVIECRNK